MSQIFGTRCRTNVVVGQMSLSDKCRVTVNDQQVSRQNHNLRNLGSRINYGLLKSTYNACQTYQSPCCIQKPLFKRNTWWSRGANTCLLCYNGSSTSLRRAGVLISYTYSYSAATVHILFIYGRTQVFLRCYTRFFWLLVGSFGRSAMSASRVVLPRLKSFKQVSFVASVVTSSTEKMKTKTNGECLYATLGVMWWQNEIFAK